ncbi:hypothetical protein IDJ77_19500 [Mucilaginibacter sp. ZT4R22]|uniref:Uncharacterized protein n=1 Tax=Mucilaginibacter pankratovii TaxID=2772110 RepID=A0ABR7WUN0_9SPHI|nr:hypothetical protein [Mucilaginibacter pankratovii]MBD1366008.1 hypothetical protein [Mucilaginibacter pankratovii]
MLKINIPGGPDNVSQDLLNQYGIPQPLNGTDIEINGDTVLLFDDEQQAVAYLDGLEEFASSIDDHSPAKNIISLIVSAIGNDEFVQTYLQ